MIIRNQEMTVRIHQPLHSLLATISILMLGHKTNVRHKTSTDYEKLGVQQTKHTPKIFHLSRDSLSTRITLFTLDLIHANRNLFALWGTTPIDPLFLASSTTSSIAEKINPTETLEPEHLTTIGGSRPQSCAFPQISY